MIYRPDWDTQLRAYETVVKQSVCFLLAFLSHSQGDRCRKDRTTDPQYSHSSLVFPLLLRIFSYHCKGYCRGVIHYRPCPAWRVSSSFLKLHVSFCACFTVCMVILTFPTWLLPLCFIIFAFGGQLHCHCTYHLCLQSFIIIGLEPIVPCFKCTVFQRPNVLGLFLCSLFDIFPRLHF